MKFATPVLSEAESFTIASVGSQEINFEALDYY